MIKDRLFLFGDYQGTRENQPLNPDIVTVPTALMRNGNFSELLGRGTTTPPAFCKPAATVSGAIYDPLTCAQFAGNIIPVSRRNAAGVNYLNAFPLPNIPGLANGTQNNYRVIRQDVRKTNTIDGRMDLRIASSDQMFARFTYDNSNFTRTSRFPLLPAGFASGANSVHGRGYAVGETHTFSSNLINEFRAGYNRYTFTNAPVFSDQPISQNLGIVNANRNAQLGGGALIGGQGGQLEYSGDYGTYAVPENTYQINDALTWIHGRHTLKGGASGIRRDVAFFRPIAGKGYFQIGNGDFTGYNISELLAGFMDNYSIGAQNGFFGTRNYEVGAFIQDDWKATNRLTLNLGFRWDLITFPTEEHDRQAALNPATGGLDLAGVNGVPRSIISTNFGNYAPRFGFAYDASGNGKTVVRGGYGIFYFLDRGGIDNQLGQQVPFEGSVSYSAQNGYRTTLTGQNAVNGSLNSTTATQPLALPGYPNFNAANPPAGINVIAVDRIEKIPSVQQYSLQVQQQIGRGGVFTVGYVGNKTTHLATGYNYNTKPLGASATAPIAFPTLGQVVYNKNNGISHYNSLQTQFNYQLAKGLNLTTSYTWAHNLDNTDGYLGFFAVSPLYAYDTRQNKGNSTLDQRHVFTASMLLDLPVGRGRMFGGSMNRGLDAVIGGWQMNTIVSAQTGSPFTPVYPTFGGSYSLRPNVNGVINQTHSVSGSWFTGNFSQPAAGTNGNVGRDSLFGPGLASGDVSLFKTVPVTERFKTELRAEVYNITNTPQFQNPDANVPDANFGRITATRLASERQMQMAVRLVF